MCGQYRKTTPLGVAGVLFIVQDKSSAGGEYQITGQQVPPQSVIDDSFREQYGQNSQPPPL
jgi:hypothetical protein